MLTSVLSAPVFCFQVHGKSSQHNQTNTVLFRSALINFVNRLKTIEKKTVQKINNVASKV